MFFKKEIVIYSKEIPIHILKDNFLNFPKNLPAYFKNIPRKYSNAESSRTIKSCPGFINFFKKSFIFTCPMDIQITFNDLKITGVGCGSGYFNKLSNAIVSMHPYEQFLKYTPSNKYKIIIKLSFYIHIKCSVPLIITNPWWNMNIFEILPGIINATNKPTEFNFFIPIEKNCNNLIINKGVPLGQILIQNSKDIKINFSSKKINKLDYDGLDYNFSNLENQIL